MNAFLAIGILVVVLAIPLFLGGWLLARWIRSKPAMAARVEAGVEAMSSHPASGYFKVMEIRGVPLLLHWSFPAGGLVLSAFVQFEPRATAALCLGYTLLIGLHELGHVVAARWLGLKVIAVEISGVGGLCRLQLPRAIKDADVFLVYSAGMLVQLALLILALGHLALFGMPNSVAGSSILLTFTLVNLFLIAVSAYPAVAADGTASDGFVLWRLFLHARGKGPHPLFTPSRVLPPETRLLSLREFVPEQFTVGVEILNDDTTPMEFVVTVLMKQLRLEREKAIELMLAIHTKGGVLVPLADMQTAEAVAAGLARDAQEQGNSFICRAVDARQAP